MSAIKSRSTNLGKKIGRGLKRYFWEGPAMTALKNVYHSSFAYSTNKQRFQDYFFPEHGGDKPNTAALLNTLSFMFLFIAVASAIIMPMSTAASFGFAMTAGALGLTVGMSAAIGGLMSSWEKRPEKDSFDAYTGMLPAVVVLLVSSPFLFVAAAVMFTMDMLGGSALKMCIFSEKDWNRHDPEPSRDMAAEGNQMQPLLGSANDATTNHELPAQSHKSLTIRTEDSDAAADPDDPDADTKINTVSCSIS